MPDQLSGTEDPSRVGSGRPWGQALAVVALYLVVGVLAGAVWYLVWEPPPGYVAEGRWIPLPPETGLASDFSGTALFALVGLLAGVLSGLLVALLLDRAELVTLGALVVGACLASVVMAQVGEALGPEDPTVLAASAEDGARLPGHLHVAGWSPYVALPFGALLSLVVVFLLVPRGWRSRAH